MNDRSFDPKDKAGVARELERMEHHVHSATHNPKLVFAAGQLLAYMHQEDPSFWDRWSIRSMIVLPPMELIGSSASETHRMCSGFCAKILAETDMGNMTGIKVALLDSGAFRVSIMRPAVKHGTNCMAEAAFRNDVAMGAIVKTTDIMLVEMGLVNANP